MDKSEQLTLSSLGWEGEFHFIFPSFFNGSFCSFKFLLPFGCLGVNEAAHKLKKGEHNNNLNHVLQCDVQRLTM